MSKYGTAVQDVTTYYTGGAFSGSPESSYPAINVKVHNFPNVQSQLKIEDDKEYERLAQIAWDSIAEWFWDFAVKEKLETVYGKNHGLSFEAGGRSNGWLVVQGLGDASDVVGWDNTELAKWQTFVTAIKDYIADQCSAESVAQIITKRLQEEAYALRVETIAHEALTLFNAEIIREDIWNLNNAHTRAHEIAVEVGTRHNYTVDDNEYSIAHITLTARANEKFN